MVGVIGIASTLLGTALAQASTYWRAQTETIETLAGYALIGGLGLLGASLPHFC